MSCPFSHLFAKLRRSALPWVLIDQAVVSGCNFLTGIVLARGLGLEDFGRFSLVWIGIYLINTIQSALITAPMMSIGPKLAAPANQTIETPEAQSYYQATLMQQLLFAFVSSGLLGLGVLFSEQWGFHWGLSGLWLWFFAVAFTFQLQDYLRRYGFTRQRPVVALLNDTISYGGQLLLLLGLAWQQQCTFFNALVVISGTSLVALVVGALQLSMLQQCRWGLVFNGSHLKRNWQSGAWLTVANLVQWAGSQGLLLLAGAFFGPASVGGIRAVINLAAPVNVLTQGLQNYLPAQTSRVHHHSQGQQTLRYLVKVGAILILVLAVIGVVLSLLAEPLMVKLYGSEFGGYASLVGWQAVYIVLGGLLLPFTLYYRTLEDNRKVALALAMAAPVAVLSTFMLLAHLGAAAVFLGLIVNQVIAIGLLCLPHTVWKTSAQIPPVPSVTGGPT